MRWYQIAGIVAVAWVLVAVTLTPLVALWIRAGKRIQEHQERRFWLAGMLTSRGPERREGAQSRRRTGARG